MQNLETIHEEFCVQLDQLDEFLGTLHLSSEQGSKLASILSNLILCTDELYRIFEAAPDIDGVSRQRDLYAKILREQLIPRLTSLEEIHSINMTYELEVRDI